MSLPPSILQKDFLALIDWFRNSYFFTVFKFVFGIFLVVYWIAGLILFVTGIFLLDFPIVSFKELFWLVLNFSFFINGFLNVCLDIYRKGELL
jgi:hypothetical protein